MNQSLEDLRDTAAGLSALARKAHNDSVAIQGRASSAGRELTATEETKIAALLSTFEAHDRELRAVRAELIDAEQDAADRTPLPRRTEPNPIANSGATMVGAPQAASVASPLFGRMFPTASRSANREFSDLGTFAKAVLERHPRLYNAASGMGDAVGSDGGFYVPVQLMAGLMDDSLQGEAIRPNATIVPMQSASISIPMFDLSNRSTGIATLEGKVTPEGSTGTTQKAKVRNIELVAKKISVLVPTTSELMQDAPALFGQLLKQAMIDALGQTLDTWFFSGTGAGTPLGILNASCLVSVAKDTGQVAATITPTNIASMVSRLAPGSWSRATWLVSPSALAQLFTMQTVVKNVAGTENVGGSSPEFFTVLPDGKFALVGRPLIVSDRCQALGTRGDVLLCDLKSYLVGIRQNAELLVDTSIGFKESEIWFRLNCRVDGQPALHSAITPRVGSATLSPFVALDTRA